VKAVEPRTKSGWWPCPGCRDQRETKPDGVSMAVGHLKAPAGHCPSCQGTRWYVWPMFMDEESGRLWEPQRVCLRCHPRKDTC